MAVSAKEKMDAILGITGGQSVDDFLNDLEQDKEKISDALQTINSEIKTQINEVQNIDVPQNFDLQVDKMPLLEIQSLELALKKVEGMISITERLMEHIAEGILASDLIDSELVHSAGVLMESMRGNIQEFMSVYKMKQTYIDKVKFAVLQHQQKKDLMDYKHKLDLEKINAAKKDSSNSNMTGGILFRQEDIINIIESEKID